MPPTGTSFIEEVLQSTIAPAVQLAVRRWRMSPERVLRSLVMSAASAGDSDRRSHLLDYTPELLEIWLEDLGRPAFHARQLFQWVFVKRVTRFADMTDLPAPLRGELQESFEIYRLS